MDFALSYWRLEKATTHGLKTAFILSALYLLVLEIHFVGNIEDKVTEELKNKKYGKVLKLYSVNSICYFSFAVVIRRG